MQISSGATELTGYFTWMSNDGIARTSVKPIIDITLTHTFENTAGITALFKGQKFALLIDTRPIKLIFCEAMQHFTLRNRKTKTNSFGALTGLSISRIIGNFYLGLNKPPVPAKLFENEANAIPWLKQFCTYNYGTQQQRTI